MGHARPDLAALALLALVVACGAGCASTSDPGLMAGGVAFAPARAGEPGPVEPDQDFDGAVVAFSPAHGGMDTTPSASAIAAARSGRPVWYPEGSRLPGPRVLGNLSSDVERVLTAAYRVAVGWLEHQPSCRSLFARLGSNGFERLTHTTYARAGTAADRRFCGAGAPAFTGIGSLRVMLCERFGQLPVDTAAVIVLHEALHSSGLDEWPGNPKARRAQEIDSMVRTACEP